MLDQYFKYPGVLRRLRSGALGGEMDRIAAHLSAIGYKRASAKIYISRIGRFSDFAARNSLTGTIDQTVIKWFVSSLPTASSRIAAGLRSSTPVGSRPSAFRSRAARWRHPMVHC